MSENLHPNLPALPPRIAKLPVDPRGFPIPWFVAKIDGKYDFRIMSSDSLRRAVVENLCWVCGEPLGTWKAFVVGPMCVITGTSGEPPSHRDCAIFSAKHCPFLSKPKVERRGDNLPEKFKMNECHLERNPGVALVLITKGYQVQQHQRSDGEGWDILFKMGKAEELLFFALGKEATREQIMESVNNGIGELMVVAQAEGPESVADLKRKYEEFKTSLPL